MRKISYEELNVYLEEILACDAFELHVQRRDSTESDYYIPYMMNDALECYLLLQKGHMTGDFDPEVEEKIRMEFVKTEDGPAIIFRQGNQNVFTIWFRDAFQILQCYRYDQIGHFWVEGQEHWRRLVYMIGTMHDKYHYMGDAVCNEMEMALLPLMEFAPFRYFTPLHDSLDEYYINSASGFSCMKGLVKEAGSKRMDLLMNLYSISPVKKPFRKMIIEEMMHPRGNRLYQLIFDKVKAASEQYPDREYEKTITAKIKEERKRIEEDLKKAGFCGTYPLFQKNRIQVLAMEEHPFTILESDHYNFKVQYMISEVSGKRSKSHQMLNAGFFKKRGNHGWIARDLEDVLSAMK